MKRSGQGSERGSNLAEYSILAIAIAVVAILAVKALGTLQSPPLEQATQGMDGIAPSDSAPGMGADGGGSEPPAVE